MRPIHKDSHVSNELEKVLFAHSFVYSLIQKRTIPFHSQNPKLWMPVISILAEMCCVENCAKFMQIFVFVFSFTSILDAKKSIFADYTMNLFIFFSYLFSITYNLASNVGNSNHSALQRGLGRNWYRFIHRRDDDHNTMMRFTYGIWINRVKLTAKKTSNNSIFSILMHPIVIGELFVEAAWWITFAFLLTDHCHAVNQRIRILVDVTATASVGDSVFYNFSVFTAASA